MSFKLSEKAEEIGLLQGYIHKERVKEFIRLLNQLCINAQIYADMDEREFWMTSNINQQETRIRAKYYFEFMEEIKKLAGEGLI